MIDTTALFIAGLEVKHAMLAGLCIVAAGVFTALYFSLKQNFNKQTQHYNTNRQLLQSYSELEQAMMEHMARMKSSRDTMMETDNQTMNDMMEMNP